jgi:hypothetical protein
MTNTTNKYLTPPNDLAPGAKARSSDINTLTQAINAAFDKVPDELALKAGNIQYALNAGTVANIYLVTLDPKITTAGLVDGLGVTLVPGIVNTGASTLNVNGLGNIPIKRYEGADVAAGDLVAGSPIRLTYNKAANTFILPPMATSQVVAAAASATAAAQSASAANTSAQSASGSATAANTSAQNALSAAQLAANWATATAGTVDGTYYGARYYAISAAQSASAAATSATQSAGAATAAVQAAGLAPQLNTVANIDSQAISSGFYQVNQATAGTKPTTYGVLQVIAQVAAQAGNSNWAFQVFFGLDNRVYTRSSINAAAWSAWRDGMPDVNGNLLISSINGFSLAGLKNALINGCMRVFQRGSAGIVIPPGNDLYTLDRWHIYNGLNVSITVNQAPQPAYNGSDKTQRMRIVPNATPTSGGIFINQRIEDSSVYAGQVATASAVVMTPEANMQCRFTHSQNFGSGGSASVVLYGPYMPASAPAAGGASVTPLASTFNIPSTVGKTLGTNDYFEFCLELDPRTTNVISVTNVQFERGPNYSPFEPRPIALELAMCQRYYQSLNFAGASGVTNSGGGDFGVIFPVPMRAAPTFTVGNLSSFVDGFTTTNITSLVLTGASINSARMSFGASSTTAGRGVVVNAGTTGGFSAEL